MLPSRDRESEAFASGRPPRSVLRGIRWGIWVRCQSEHLVGADQHLPSVGQSNCLFVLATHRKALCVGSIMSHECSNWKLTPLPVSCSPQIVESLLAVWSDQVAVGGVGAACRWVTSTVRSPTFVMGLQASERSRIVAFSWRPVPSAPRCCMSSLVHLPGAWVGTSVPLHSWVWAQRYTTPEPSRKRCLVMPVLPLHFPNFLKSVVLTSSPRPISQHVFLKIPC